MSYNVCSQRASPGGHLVQFLHSLYSQLCQAQAIASFKPQEDSTWLREAVDDPDEVFKKVVLFPLLECEPLHHKVSTVQYSTAQYTEGDAFTEHGAIGKMFVANKYL